MLSKRLLDVSETSYTTASDPVAGLTCTPKYDGVFRITVAISAAAKFRVKNGTTDLVFNADTNLVADGLYAFVVSCRAGQEYVFKFSANVTIRELQVDEIEGGVI